MPNTEKIKLVDKFFSGIVRDDRSKIVGALSNAEEVDIFTSQDYIQAEQIMIADAMPATTTGIYAYTAGDDDTVYGYGETTAGAVRLVSVATGGADNPGAFANLLAASTDSTNDASTVSDFKFFRTVEASNPTSLYYIAGTSTTWYLRRWNLGAAAEQIYNGTTWAAGTSHASSQLTGLTGTNMRPTMKVIYGELYICHGKFIAKVDNAGLFTEKAFTLPAEWEAVDIIPVSDISLILARNKNVLMNETKCFWWDLTTTATFDDSFTLPFGGPQWLLNYKETIFILCAINTVGKFFLAPAFPGGKPQELPNFRFTNLGVETSTQPISSPKNVSAKDGIVYFGLFKTDKSGIYAIGQLDSDKSHAIILSKRFHTTDYSLHKPTALLIQGPNFYCSFLDNGTQSYGRCESKNSPTRSSNAVIETVWLDDDKPFQNKTLTRAYLVAQQLPASTSLALSVASDYSSSYTAITRSDASAFNTANGIFGLFRPAAFNNKKVYKAKVAWTSSTTSTAKLVAIGLRLMTKEIE